MRPLCLGLALLLSTPAAAGPTGDRVVIDTGQRTLTVYEGTKPLKQFKVSLAGGGKGKVKRGDRRNPIGTYRLLKGRPSKFHRFLPVSYPNSADAERGLAAKLITEAEARAIREADQAGRLPPQNTALGGAIGVHGLGNAVGIDLGPLQVLHRYLDATDGCFLLTDWEVDELEKLYRPGATLEIK